MEKCQHCGKPLKDNSVILHRGVDDEEFEFCGEGCKARHLHLEAQNSILRERCVNQARLAVKAYCQAPDLNGEGLILVALSRLIDTIQHGGP